MGARVNEIEEVYRQRFRAFLLSATAMIGDGETALDVVQETFALALRKRRTFRGDGPLEAWLWKILVNRARDGQRQARLRESPVAELTAADGSHPEGRELLELLRALPERQRAAIFLRYYADLSYAQIAEVLGVRPGTVAASLNAAHDALRGELEEIRT
jgi:RNA polymerase sigma factor (sigma-70 family)